MHKPTRAAKKTRFGAAATLLLAALSAPAEAATGAAATRADSPVSAAPTFERTLPPVGFVKFCGRHPAACAARPGGPLRPHLTARQWEMVSRINADVNADVAPASDEVVYGEPEHWDYPDRRGDCEDYALLKQRDLEALGLPRAALLLTVVLDDRQDGHAVLTLATSAGDFILDNRSDSLRLWSDSGYTFLKRQSPGDPRNWLALSPEPPEPVAPVSARTRR